MTIQVIDSSGRQKGATSAMMQLYDNVAAGAIASWDVSSISQAYNYLKVLVQGRSDNATVLTTILLRLNNDSAANYNGNNPTFQNATVVGGETLGATSMPVGAVPGSTATANRPGNSELVIHDYKGTVFHKQVTGSAMHTRDDSTTNQEVQLLGGLWRSTAAVNRITVTPAAGNFIAGSRLTIYGLL